MSEEVQVEVSAATKPREYASKSEEKRYHAQVAGKLPPTAEELVGNDMLWLIAKTCHEVNKTYSAAVIGDFSTFPWEETSPEQRKSVYEGVLFVLNNPNVTAEEIHAAWMEHKLRQGWIYGNIKDEGGKTHPNLLPFFQLHAHERAKDDIFLAVCKSLLGKQDA